MENAYQKTKAQVFDVLNVNERGLTAAAAAQRQQQYGKNAIEEGKKRSLPLIFLDQYKDLLVIILIIAAIVSALVDENGISSALVILVVITMNAILGTVQHVKAQQSLDALKAMSAPMAKVWRGGETVTVPSDRVTVGDVVLLEAGDYICADGRILENYSLKVNESSLTGESLSVEKEDCELSGECPIGDRKNMVFSGSFVTYGRATFVVTDIGMSTELGKVATLLKNTQEKKTPLQVNLDDFGRRLSFAIIGICILVAGLSIWRGETLANAFMFAVALAVAAIPEALSSIVTIVLSFGTQKMARENAIIRKLQAVEGLGSVSIICSDKTGTLTQNKMTVKKFCVDTHIIEEDEVDFVNPLQRKLLRMGILCNDSTNADGNEIGDPTEVALINYGDLYGFDEGEKRKKYPRVAEIPFDSDRKLMTTVNEVSGEYVMIVKGAVDVLLDRCSHIETRKGVDVIAREDRITLESINQKLSQSGLRVLAFAYKTVTEFDALCPDDECDLTFVGLISMMDPPREESAPAVAECKRAGIRPVMITGDHRVTAAAIARQIGILQDDSEAIEGAEIDHLSDEELKDFVPNISVYARVSPEHKIRIVRAWQERGNIVAMTGDGVNDAPALKQADVGVAMGITGSEVAKDAASMVLTDDNFATIIKAVENGRNVYANIKKAIKFLLSGNMAGILSVLFATLAALPLPFAPVHLLFINLLTDSLPAIALGLEPHDPAVMDEKPRPMHESILTKDFMLGILLEGIVITIMTMAAFMVGLDRGGAAMASTMAFATLCLSRLVHGFNSKSEEAVAFTSRVFDNRFLWAAFAIGFVLLNAVLLIPGLQGVFQVTPLPFELLMTIYGLAVLNLPAIQIMKLIRTRLQNKK